MDATIRDRLLKIHRLANDSGATDGERAAAAGMLSKLLADHGLTLDDLIAQMSEPVTLYEFTFENRWESTLLLHVVGKVVNAQGELKHFSYRDKRRKKNVVMYQLTAAQAVEATRLYEFYRDALRSEFDLLLDAFIQKHHLYSNAPATAQEMTEEVLLWLQRLQAMKESLRDLPDPMRGLIGDGMETERERCQRLHSNG